MATKKLRSIKGRRMRLTALDECGAPEAASAPITLSTSAATDDIIDTATAHGFVEGDTIQFTALTGGTGGPVINTTYYVRAASLAANTFTISATPGGASLNWTTDITAGTVRRVAPCASIVTEGIITVTWSLEVEDGEEYTQKNAWGDFCISEKDGSRIKWVNIAISMCEIDPNILRMVGGGDLVMSGADVIGATFGQDPNPLAFAIEVWTKAAGADACAGGNPEWGYFAAPFVRNGMLDGDITIENGPMSIGLKGEGVGAASAWGVGPYGDNPMIDPLGIPAGQMLAIVKTTVQPPAVTVGCVALP